ncbi:MAG: RelA/SpoT family protein [Candidatus Thiosymbion ectosymbiont of Robbea hypermnestra]|nr:RelA/SpoT family protein [Candidatus Thiosymbion ectosymbiont of Robbea hypermnestra]
MTENRPRFLISDLCAFLDAYLSAEQIREVYRAYLFGAEAHEGQWRKSGEPYIYHPIAVARLLAGMRMDYKCLMAALLHDVIEDTDTAREQLVAAFDEEIAELVDGVSKLTQIDFRTREEAQAASFRKMMLAMTKDIRVILIKLADRLHNMRTLGVMAPATCRRVSRETLEIYAPIANRLGLYDIRVELEELGFAHYWPWRYRILERALSRAHETHTRLMEEVATALRERLEQAGIPGAVSGRRKHSYGIYLKMRDKKRPFSDVVDVFAFRVIVAEVDTCYRVLGLAHNLYRPMPGRFKDYIAIAKSNGYQSLHTVLLGPQGLPIEIQVRTEDMQHIADKGIAAHWMYKSDHGGGNPQVLAADWLRNLSEMQRGYGDSVEFLEHVKVDLFPDEVYVFTPRGRILVLPKGATVVDFAYAIHSDVGNSCVAARIDRHLAPLRTVLHNGQTVEIINTPGGTPNPVWLKFVVTGKARVNIRSYLKNLQRREAEDLGQRLLDAELKNFGLAWRHLPGERLQRYLIASNLTSAEQLLADIGLGNRMPALVARRLAVESLDEAGGKPRPETETGQPPRFPIRGTEGMVVNFARCCRPIPGDGVVGIFSPGKGIVIHRQECRNLGDFQRQGDKWLDVEWAAEPGVDFSTEIRIEAGNRRGVLATVATAIAEMGSNIENIQSHEKDGVSASLDFLLTVQDRRHLARIIRRLRAIPLVMRILRMSR